MLHNNYGMTDFVITYASHIYETKFVYTQTQTHSHRHTNIYIYIYIYIYPCSQGL